MATKVEIPKKMFRQVLAFFKGDEKKTNLWFKTSNPLLGYISPIQMIQWGNTKKLHYFITDQFFDNYKNAQARTANLRKQLIGAKGAKKVELDVEYLAALENELHQMACHMATLEVTIWPRIRDLPVAERKPFRKWLTGQTAPLIQGVDHKNQDAYYDSDYSLWKYHWSKGQVAKITD